MTMVKALHLSEHMPKLLQEMDIAVGLIWMQTFSAGVMIHPGKAVHLILRLKPFRQEETTLVPSVWTIKSIVGGMTMKGSHPTFQTSL
jgi:hypothetical protein